MCTAITYKTADHYFGRNLDLEHSFNERIVITPRNYPLPFRKHKTNYHHYAIIGMAIIDSNYPLYYDATNEAGLSMAALNFPGNAVYRPYVFGKDNITPFELIPRILAECKNVDEALILLNNINLFHENFSNQLPLSPLHWIIADSNQAITVEPLSNGLQITENSLGVLTNNPPFDFHVQNIENYLNVTSTEATNRFSKLLDLRPTSRGMGGIGLPGDLSSASRFVRAAFTKFNSVCGSSEQESVSQFFHILGSVVQQNGCVQVGSKYERTVYSSCCNTDKCIYYYTTYENSQITAVSLFKENLDSESLIFYPLITNQQIRYIN